MKRERSFVYKIFQGQLKNVMTCPAPGCDRVSTTFDPFMYLPLEMPGSQECEVVYTYVWCDGGVRKCERRRARLSRDASAEELVKKVRGDDGGIDLFVADVWKNEVRGGSSGVNGVCTGLRSDPASNLLNTRLARSPADLRGEGGPLA